MLRSSTWQVDWRDRDKHARGGAQRTGAFRQTDMAQRCDGAWLEQPACDLHDVIRVAARPKPAVLEIDGFTWRSAGPSDASTLEALAAHASNRLLFSLPESEERFEAAVGWPGFKLPMLCLRDSSPVGAAATNQRNNHSRNLRLICFFADPAHAALPLAAYVRHLFWMLPLHRVYCQFPMVVGAAAYVRVLKGVGFQEEGTIRSHALIGGKPCDVVVLGALRDEFEFWCQENEPRLVL